MNSKAVLVQLRWNHGGRSAFAKWRQEECGGEGNFFRFQVLESMKVRVNSKPLYISHFKCCLLSPDEAYFLH